MFLQGTGKGKFDKGKGKTQFSALKAYRVCGSHLAGAVPFLLFLQGKGKGKTDQFKRKATNDPYGGALVVRKVNGCVSISHHAYVQHLVLQ